MPNVFNIAKYIISCIPNISAMKLEKLIYYSQAWSLAILKKPLFKNKIEAWSDDPVCPDLYRLTQHNPDFRNYLFNSKQYNYHFDDDQRAVMDGILKCYGRDTNKSLSYRVHQEMPWINGRKNISNNRIQLSDMKNYYSILIK